jgi:hypothetical protein
MGQQPQVSFFYLQLPIASTTWKTRKLICNIEPLRPPPGSVVGEVGVYPLRFEARAQVEHYSPRPLDNALYTENIPP